VLSQIAIIYPLAVQELPLPAIEPCTGLSPFVTIANFAHQLGLAS